MMVSLGHSGRFDLALLVEEASELVELLAAAIGEANGADNSTLVRTFEGYWPLRTVPRWSSAYMYTRTQMMRAQGVLGVRFDACLCDGAPGVVVAMAESAGGMNLQVSVAEAMELVELLAAAIGDANGVEQPCVDVTLDECTWACCKAVR
ncbi:hypothetical protein ACFV24_31195 [Nocardia fluminea]|uniref:hypothetical protein n=1 Tax=Nocardia fluminea TaxID=134984 RepID=UPI003670A065